MRKLNFLQILFHFIATYCCIFLFRTLHWINNIRVLEITEKHSLENIQNDFSNYGITAKDIFNLTAFPPIATLIGMLLGIGISLFISIKKKWPLINSLVIFILCFSFNYFDLPIFNYLQTLYPLTLTKSLFLQLITLCVLFVSIAMFLFFSKIIKNYIESFTEKKSTSSSS